jgi:hypothetical protein
LSIRKFFRLTVGVAALIPFATCTDFTGPRAGHGVRVPIVPTFSQAATLAKALYTATGIEFDRVRIVITRNEAELLKDTTVAFSPTSTDLTLPLFVTANPGETVTATIEYRNADIVLYSGTQSVVTVAIGTAPTTAPTPLVLIPVGPGATAATIELSPASGSFPTSASVPFAATAFTADHVKIDNAIFGWTVEDGTVASVNASGVVQPTSKGGVAKVRATTLNGKFAEASITFLTAPASIKLESGGGQISQYGETLLAPIVVKVLDANSTPVPGATVNFAVATGGGSLEVLNAVSDAQGLVRVKWTLGSAIVNAEQAITATAAALPNGALTITATATERPIVKLVFSQPPTKSLMGATIAPAVAVRAADDKGRLSTVFNSPVTIALGANPAGALLGGTLTVTPPAGTGTATFSNLTINNAAIGYTLTATTTGNIQPVTSDAFDVDQVPAGLSLNAGGSQSKLIRSTLDQIVVKVADANGIGVPGVTVDFDVVTGGGTIAVDNGVTDASGLARATWTLGNAVGAQSIKATSAGLTDLTIGATAIALPAVKLMFAQQPTNALVAAAISPAVTVVAVDADGNTVSGFTGGVSLGLANATGIALNGTTSVTAVGGTATFSNLSVGVAGAGFKLIATSGSLTTALSDPFNVTPRPPFALVFQRQPSNVVFGNPIAPAVEVRIVDINGATSTAANDAVTIALETNRSNALLSGTLTVNAVNGIATFSNLIIDRADSATTIRASSGTLQSVVSIEFDVTFPSAVARTWTGAISTDWNTAGNWSPSGVPTNQDSVTIVPTTNQPVILASAAAQAILVGTGATLKVDAPVTTPLNTFRIHNKGTLQLTSANLFATIDNQATVVADSFAVVSAFSNVGVASKLRVISTTGGFGFLSVAGVLSNEGAIELDDIDGGSPQIVVSDSLVNKVGATLTANPGLGGQRVIQGILRNHGSISSSNAFGLVLYPFGKDSSLNDGSITLSGGGTLYTFLSDTTQVFKNTGTIALGAANWQTSSGKFVLRSGTYSGGTFLTSASALDIDFSKFTMPMMIDILTRFPGDSLNVPAGQTAELAGGQIAQRATVRGTLRVNNPTFALTTFASGANIYSGGLLYALRDAFIDKVLNIASNGTLRVEGSGANVNVRVGNSFQNDGLIELTSGGKSPFTSGLTVAGALTNGSKATINALNGTGGRRYIEGTLNNQGIINVDGATYLELLQSKTAHVNSGTINLVAAINPGRSPGLANTNSLSIVTPDLTGQTLSNTGTIKIGAFRTLNAGAQTVVNNGTAGVIGGNGTIRVPDNAGFVTNGRIAPGGLAALGTLTFSGNLNLGKGTLEIDVGGFASSGAFDQLIVGGNLTLGGTLNVTKINGFNSQDQWDLVISPSSFSGSFAAVTPTFWYSFLSQLNPGFIGIGNIVIGGPPTGKPPV